MKNLIFKLLLVFSIFLSANEIQAKNNVEVSENSISTSIQSVQEDTIVAIVIVYNPDGSIKEVHVIYSSGRTERIN